MFENDPQLPVSILGLFTEIGPNRTCWLKIYHRLPETPFQWLGLALPNGTSVHKQLNSGDYAKQWRSIMPLLFQFTPPGHVFGYWVRGRRPELASPQDEAYPFPLPVSSYGFGAINQFNYKTYTFTPNGQPGSAMPMRQVFEYFQAALRERNQRLPNDYDTAATHTRALLICHLGVSAKEKPDELAVLLRELRDSAVLPTTVVIVGTAKRLQPLLPVMTLPEFTLETTEWPFLTTATMDQRGLAWTIQDALYGITQVPASEAFTVAVGEEVIGSSATHNNMPLALTELQLPLGYQEITLRFPALDTTYIFTRDQLTEGVLRNNFDDNPVNPLGQFEIPLLHPYYHGILLQ